MKIQTVPSIFAADSSVYADLPRRALAFMVDCLILGIPCTLLFLLAFPWFLDDRLVSWFGTTLTLNFGVGVILAIYSACFHASPMQATPGKKLMDIKVVGHNGKGIGFTHAFIRQVALTACGPVSLLVGLILVPFTQHRQGRHDSLCNTFVVHRWAFNDPP